MATAQYILANKGSLVHTVCPDATVLEATQLMNRNKVGGLMVMDGDRIAGIITERDVLRRVVAEELPPSSTRVADVMTREVICCRTDTDLDEASRIMRDQRIRHLPVCSPQGKLVGMISLGDLNAWYLSIQEAQLDQLNNYVYGRG